MTDGRVIDAEGVETQSLLMAWGLDWAETLRGVASDGSTSDRLNPDIIGQAIAGALYQAGQDRNRSGRSREELVNNLTLFLVRALRPD
jgi:hypothetical protein